MKRNTEDRHTEASLENLVLSRGLNSTLNFVAYSTSLKDSRLRDLEYNISMENFEPLVIDNKELDLDQKKKKEAFNKGKEKVRHPYNTLNVPTACEAVVSEGKDFWI